jgi:hypothetical protein
MTFWRRVSMWLAPKKRRQVEHPLADKVNERELREAQERKRDIMQRLVNLGIEADVILRREGK